MTYRAWPTQVQDLYFTKGILNTYTVNVTEKYSIIAELHAPHS